MIISIILNIILFVALASSWNTRKPKDIQLLVPLLLVLYLVYVGLTTSFLVLGFHLMVSKEYHWLTSGQLQYLAMFFGGCLFWSVINSIMRK